MKRVYVKIANATAALDVVDYNENDRVFESVVKLNDCYYAIADTDDLDTVSAMLERFNAIFKKHYNREQTFVDVYSADTLIAVLSTLIFN